MNTNRASTRGSTDFIKPAACALAGVFAAMAFSSASAQSLEPGQCLPMAQMNAALIADGQRTMIIGDRLAMQNDNSREVGIRVDRYVNTVTSNADGSLGYQLEGDLPRARPSRDVCVVARLTNVRLFDARRPGVPPEALLGGQFDQVMREIEQLGTRPMVQADTVHPNADGTYRRGLPLTVAGNMNERAAIIYARLADGTTQRVARMGEVDYTPAALERLANAPVTMAALRPN